MMKVFKLVWLVGIICIILSSADLVLAQNTDVNLPDLIIDSLMLVPQPKEGESLSSIQIRIKNQGFVDAGENKLQISCLVAECIKDKECDGVSQTTQGVLDVPLLKKGESITLEWLPSSPIKWVVGKYSIVAEVDKYNAVNETEELNNITKSLIYITSFPVTPNSKTK